MSFKTVSAILRAKWLIEKQWAVQHFSIVENILQGKAVNFAGNPVTNPHVTNVPEWDEQGQRPLIALTATSNTYKASRYRSFDEAPEGSIALIPITGPILKYGGECGEPGSVHMTDWTKQASASSKITGIIYRFDTPGGMVDGTASLADAIKSSGKRTVGFVDDGMMASAGMWLGSACDELYASQVTDTIGSIGVFTSIWDFADRLKILGITIHDIYAPQSSEKNIDYKKALEGDYKLVQDELKFICDQFISTIKTNRGDKLNLKAGNPFKGAMYFAEEAISIGLIDGIMPFDEVVSSFASKPSTGTNTKHSSQQNQNTMFGKNKFESFSALKGVAAKDITEEMLDKANANLTEQGIDHVTLVADSALEEMTATIAQVKALTNANAKLTDDLKEANDKVAEYGDQAGAMATKTNAAKDKIEGDAKKSWVNLDDEHNEPLKEQA